MASSKNNSTKTKKKTGNTKGRRTEAHATAKANGRRVEHPVRKFWIAVFYIFFPLVVGLVSSAITGDAMKNFGELNQPPLAPPAWLFPVAWSILYILMGVASYLVYRWRPKTDIDKQSKVAWITIYFIQLVFNFLWTILFFKLEVRFFAFGWLIAMWLMILALIVMAFRGRKAAGWLMLPYLLWCTFAGYLNIMIAVLN